MWNNNYFLVRIPSAIMVAVLEIPMPGFFSSFAIRPRECTKT
jgi:hypothetical protein